MSTITMSSNVIATHDGPFHADDVFAVTLLRLNGVLGTICRTRNEDFLQVVREAGGWLVDVGGEYNPAERKYDHHFSPRPQGDSGELLASAGMIAKRFGEKGWIARMAAKIDAVDNGVKVPDWNFSLVIHKCNPINGNEKEFFARFHTLVGLFEEAMDRSPTEEAFIKRIQENPLVQGWLSEHEKP